MAKECVILISGAPEGQNLREVTLEAGTTCGDILRTLGLEGYLLSREGSATNFAAEENIYQQIGSGEKLRASPIAEVGLLC